MKHTRTISMAITAGLLFSPLALADNYKQEKEKAVAIGMGTGVVIGAIVAGPIGAGVAGIIGAIAGDNSATNSQLKETQVALTASEAALSDSQQELFAMRDAMQSMKQDAKMTQVALTRFRFTARTVCHA